MPTPIDYRTPRTPSRPLGNIHEHLRLREQAMLGKIAVLLLVGLPATFVGPWLIGSICTSVSLRLGLHISWAVAFLGAAAIFIPILFWTEYRTRGKYFENSLAGASPSSTPWSQSLNTWNALAGFYGDPEVLALGLTEICLWGPRQILDAVGKIRMVRRLGDVNRIRVEGAVASLLASEHAVEIRKLELSEQDMAALLAALGYLLVYDWIGVSKDGQRVWLTSESRKKLAS